MHACMIYMLTTRLAPHDRLMCSQAAAKQWSLHDTMDTVSMAIQVVGRYAFEFRWYIISAYAVVQWLPSLCRMCRPRTIARSTTTSLSACSARVVRGRHLRVSLHSRASQGFKESSSTPFQLLYEPVRLPRSNYMNREERTGVGRCTPTAREKRRRRR